MKKHDWIHYLSFIQKRKKNGIILKIFFIISCFYTSNSNNDQFKFPSNLLNWFRKTERWRKTKEIVLWKLSREILFKQPRLLKQANIQILLSYMLQVEHFKKLILFKVNKLKCHIWINKYDRNLFSTFQLKLND